MRKKVEFGSKKIGDNERVPFIAEIGVNHLGKICNALDLVESAVKAGSDFLKFQTYIAEERYDKNNPRYKEFTSLLKDWELSRDEQIEMWNLAKSLKAEVFTSVFELLDVDLRFSVVEDPNQRGKVNAPPVFRRSFFLLGGEIGFVVVDLLVELLSTLS